VGFGTRSLVGLGAFSLQLLYSFLLGEQFMPNELPKNIRLLLAKNADRASIARSVAEAIRNHGQYRWTGIYDVDIERGLVSNVAWSGPNAPEYPTFPVTKGLTSRAVTEKRTVNVGDVAIDKDYLTALTTTRSEIIVPVVDEQGSHVFGTIDVESELPNAFDASVQRMLEECAIVLRHFWTTS
jgi:putative methionine-R-sulfoxide reductase with GAF domain